MGSIFFPNRQHEFRVGSPAQQESAGQADTTGDRGLTALYFRVEERVQSRRTQYWGDIG